MRSLLVQQKRKVTSGTKEWADFNVNCIDGCYNNCRYCYARKMASRFGRRTDEDWGNMKIRWKAVAKTYHKFPGRVMFPSSHDIIDFPHIRKACFAVLEKLLESGNEVLVTTKPRFSIITGIDEKFSQYKEQMEFRFTITSVDSCKLNFWEPNAPPFQERICSLKYAFGKGYKTSVSIEPFLDYDPRILVETVAPYSTESIWIGKMNYIQRTNLSAEEAPLYDEIRANCKLDHLRDIYQDLRGYPRVMFKDSIRIKLGL